MLDLQESYIKDEQVNLKLELIRAGGSKTHPIRCWRDNPVQCIILS